ncbi:MAG: FimV/HubP family polar landmark protein [Giesbergeria sp.]
MHRWKYSALAAAALASVVLYAPDAYALALGPITVKSALGEPLRAEIDLPRITPAEAESLKVATAGADTFRTQGMEYSAAVAQVRMVLQRRPDGRSVLLLSSNSPVNEPFVDLVIDATWATGRITRSYTMLFDPPTLRRATPSVTVAPQISTKAPAVAPVARPAPVTAARSSGPERQAPVSSATSDSVTVKAGDTAGRIANAHRPGAVSLDQMLVAMLRSNPEAFIGGNVNRIKAGAVLQVPSEAQATAMSAAEAHQTIAAQSRDFNEFRRKLATSAPTAETAASGRSESGRVQTKVQEQKAASTSPDKLTLSKGGVKGSKTSPEALAARKQANEASARVEELSKNISDLNKLAGASDTPDATPKVPSPAETPAQSGTSPAVTATETPAATTPAEPPATSASVPETAPTATEPATTASEPAGTVATSEMAPASAPETPAPVITAPVKSPPPPPAPAEEPSFISGLLDNPLIPAGSLVLLLLLGYGGYRVAQSRRGKSHIDSSFLESRLQPDSFFGASGGQRVDTAGTDTAGSSMAYSPSQLDAGGDVDPVAEADVYLAYGRDLQAEEILKEAIRHNPERVSVHAKLGEIYAKRQDRKSLEAVAKDIFKITHGEGADWNRVSELGRDLDPENAFYQPGGQLGEAPALTPPSQFASTYGASEGPPSLPPDLDLDLDLDLADEGLTEAPPASSGSFAAAAAAAAAVSTAKQSKATASAPTDQEPAWSPPTGSGSLAWEAPQSSETAPQASDPVQFQTSGMHDFPLDLPSLDTEPQQLDQDTAKPFITPDSGLMDFDLDHLSLDLDAKAAAAATSAKALSSQGPAAPEDPLATKLALAHEFDAIGDSDGARTLIEEVIAEATGETKARAQRMLSELN